MTRAKCIASVAIAPACFLSTWLVEEHVGGDLVQTMFEVRLAAKHDSPEWSVLGGPFYQRKTALESHARIRDTLASFLREERAAEVLP